MNKERLMQVILSPITSEKSTFLSEKNGKIVLKVLPNATKEEIKQAVEMLFEIDVADVNTVKIKGKTKANRFYKAGKMYGRKGKRSDIKKAYITLVPGQNLDIENQATKIE